MFESSFGNVLEPVEFETFEFDEDELHHLEELEAMLFNDLGDVGLNQMVDRTKAFAGASEGENRSTKSRKLVGEHPEDREIILKERKARHDIAITLAIESPERALHIYKNDVKDEFDSQFHLGVINTHLKQYKEEFQCFKK